MTIREALISMGYREVKSGHWVKPVGYVALSYHEGKNEWTNYFRSAQGEILRWETKPLESDQDRYGTYLHQLKSLECWTRTDFYINADSAFELSAIDL